VEQQTTVFIDDHERCWTEIQYFAELALMLYRLDSE
jgi:hypothetical protein